jgi:AcrR family transcriptional regulator
MSAALAVFGEHGLAAARLDDIAKRAGLSKGTIYLYFPNKEELFREMVRQTVVSQIEAGERQFDEATGTSTEALKAYMRSYWTFIRSPDFSPIFRLIHAEIPNFPELAQFYAQEVVARSHRLIASIITRGIASGEFREIDPLVAARMLTAPFVIHGLWCSHRHLLSSVAKKSDNEILDELMDFYLYAIRAPASASMVDNR